MNTFLTSNDKKTCYGCLACVYSCPKHIIKISSDQGGFKYPYIENTSECINCGKCRNVCPNDNSNGNIPTLSAGLKHKDDIVRKKSSSGGAFTAITDILIKQGYKVYGCALDKNFTARHICATDSTARNQMRKSKYVASDIEGLFPIIRDELNNGIKICFSGTPCQVFGLKLFLSRDYENLFTIDFICHGVSSPSVFFDYVNLCGDGSSIEKLEFRDKDFFSWRAQRIKVYREDKKKSNYEDYYMKMFSRGFGFRTGCSSCKLASPKRVSEISMADFWGVKWLKPEMEDDLGVSLCFFNNEKGIQVLKLLNHNSKIEIIDTEKAIKSCPHMNYPSNGSLIDSYFWKKYAVWSKKKFFNIFGGDSIHSKIIRKSREYLIKYKNRLMK